MVSIWPCSCSEPLAATQHTVSGLALTYHTCLMHYHCRLCMAWPTGNHFSAQRTFSGLALTHHTYPMFYHCGEMISPINYCYCISELLLHTSTATSMYCNIWHFPQQKLAKLSLHIQRSVLRNEIFTHLYGIFRMKSVLFIINYYETRIRNESYYLSP